MSFSSFFSNQAKHPTGIFGRLVMSLIFDKGNAFLNGLVREQLSVQASDHILEIGYGTGKLIHELSGDLKEGCIQGVDPSEAMVRIATRRNRKPIQAGRVHLILGRFSRDLFQPDSFNKVCSTNTVYFWSGLEQMLVDIAEVMKPAGLLLLAFEDAEQLAKKPLDASVFRIYTAGEIEKAVEETGRFQKVETVSTNKGSQIFHCLRAEKKT